MLILCGALMLTPLIGLMFNYTEWRLALGFWFPAFLLFLIGGMLKQIFAAREYKSLTVQEGGLIVLFAWTLACIFSALPFMFILKFNFTQAVFESVSGWTTTGLTLVDVENAPGMILLWRSILQYAGGAGLAIIMLSAIAGPSGTGLSMAEGRTDQLVPNVRESAKRVVGLYFGYAFIGIVMYFLAGMSLFDSINHAFTAVATGGFSTHSQSIAFWNSPTIELITIFLMILGNFNFMTAYLIVNRKFKAVYRNGEIRVLIFVALSCALLTFFFVVPHLYTGTGKLWRISFFEVISALTGTGFSTTSYTHWPSLGFLILTVAMIVGGGTCSTSGGLKQYRVYLMYKAFIWDIRRQFVPRSAVVENFIWQGEQRDFIKSDRIRQAAIYILLYLAFFVLGSGILAGYGYPLSHAMFEFASALGTVGLSIGITTLHSPTPLLWTETLGMFLGRLEFFVVFVGIGKLIKDSLDMFR